MVDNIYPGRTSYLMIGRQSFPSTPVTPTIAISAKGGGFDTQPRHEYPKEFRKTMQSRFSVVRTGQETNGEINVNAYPSGGGLEHLLQAALGTVASSSLGSGAYLHDFTINETTLPSWTVAEGLGNVNPDVYVNAMLKTLKISVKEGAAVELDSTWVARGVNRAIYTELTPSYATAPAFTYANAAVTLDGTATVLVKDYELDIDRGTALEYVMNGSMDAYWSFPTDMAVNGKMTMLFTETEYKRLLGNPTAATTMQTTATPVAINTTFTGGLIGGAQYYKFNLNLPTCYYDKGETKYMEDGLVQLPIDFTAIKSGANATMTAYVISTAASPLAG